MSESVKSKLLVLALMRNEERRFLPSVLRAWKSFADHILILDDGSTDASVEVAREEGAEVVEMAESDPAWGHEWPKRARLFNAGVERLSEGEYAMILDLDMVPLRSPRPLLETEPDAVAFNLYDLWTLDPLAYREGELWRAHRVPKVWLFRKPREPEEGWIWNERGLHSGHLPLNLPISQILFAPPDYGILHYAYVSAALREEKANAYLSQSEHLSPEEISHAQSILDPSPTLRRLHHHPSFPVELNTKNIDEDSDRLRHQRTS